MRVLLTRPAKDSDKTSRLLLAKGLETHTAPLFTLVPLAKTFSDLNRYQAVLFTSRHAARIFCTANRIPSELTALCVGDETADTARRGGFTTSLSAGGNAKDLFRLVQDRYPPKTPLLRLAGEMETDPLVYNLRQAGYVVTPETLYRMDGIPALPEETVDLLKAGGLDGVVFFSPRTARHFHVLLEQAGLAKACRTMTAWCISEATGKALGSLPFQSVQIAAAPTQHDVIDLLLHER